MAFYTSDWETACDAINDGYTLEDEDGSVVMKHRGEFRWRVGGVWDAEPNFCPPWTATDRVTPPQRKHL